MLLGPWLLMIGSHQVVHERSLSASSETLQAAYKTSACTVCSLEAALYVFWSMHHHKVSFTSLGRASRSVARTAASSKAGVLAKMADLKSR